MEVNDQKEFKDLRWLETTAKLLDSQFSIPGTKFKFGLDPLIGLIPVIGDVSTFILSGIMIAYMSKYGVSRKVLILMILNLLVDAVFGGVPVIGNIFDFIFKANDRNIKLLKEHYHEGKHTGKGNWIIACILLFLLAFLVLLGFGLWKLFQFIFNLF